MGTETAEIKVLFQWALFRIAILVRYLGQVKVAEEIIIVADS